MPQTARVVSIVGARPQFIKAAPVARALRERCEEVLVHTGQHYDREMSQVFFDQLGIPAPDYDLGVGSGPHGAQTGAMLSAIEPLLADLEPGIVLVYGDTNTTLAGALAAAKMDIPVAHVEAGLRSFNRSMPEEINRVVVDHLAELLFCPAQTAADNLAAEGIRSGVHVVGDVMLDALRIFSPEFETAAERVLGSLGLERRSYHLATVHRAANADDPDALARLIEGFARVEEPVLWAVHPRTRARLAEHGLEHAVARARNVRVLDPLPYLETMGLLLAAKTLLTDSGGMQKEAYFLGVPCVTLREETEWVETVALGWNTLVGADPERIAAAAHAAQRPAERPPVYGDGHAAERIAAIVASRLGLAS